MEVDEQWKSNILRTEAEERVVEGPRPVDEELSLLGSQRNGKLFSRSARMCGRRPKESTSWCCVATMHRDQHELILGFMDPCRRQKIENGTRTERYSLS